jgi:GPH family glycoside/pentoside/hexuronide:cation symporter
MQENTQKESLSFIQKVGYGIASCGDALVYALIGTFLMFFLTTVAGIDPKTAGILTAIGAVWNAFFNPIMGFLSDKVRSRLGKRRVLMLMFSLPLALSVFLLFTALPIPGIFKSIYYGIMVMAFWTSYTGFFVPYLALGAEYTTDYHDRTLLRLFASFFNMIGNLLAMFMPTMLVEALSSHGFSQKAAWSLTGALLGIIAAATVLITFSASKAKDPPCPADKSEKGAIKASFNIRKILKEYLEVARLKPMKWLILASLASLCCYAMLMADMMYFLTYNLNFPPLKKTLCLMARSFVGIAAIPFIARLATKIDKKGTLISLNLFGSILLLICRMTGVHNLPLLVCYMLGTSILTVTYWQLVPSIYYDVCEYDFLVNGRYRQGIIVSFQGLVESLAVGIGSFILGQILGFAGFIGDQAVQTPAAERWIFNCTSIVPVIFALISCFAIYKYPIDREAYKKIVDLIASRKNA